MKALLFIIGLMLIVGAEGASKIGPASGTQIAVQVLIGFGCIAISALCPSKLQSSKQTQ